MKNQLFSALFLLSLILPTGVSAREQADGRGTRADIVVYGATPGGVCAAIAASREGATVILLEPTDHIGGLNTGGLSFSDSNQTVRSTVMGLFDEWHTRIEKDYSARGIKLPYQVRVKDQSKWTYEPHVALRVTKQMLDEAHVKVLPKQVLQSVRKEGTRISSLVTDNGAFAAKTFIDATYEGDLMAAAGVSWTIGREGKAEYGESLAGKRYPKSRMNINGFDSEGQILPLITTTDAGPEDEGDSNVMVYSFRLCLTDDPKNRVPFPKPESYDPARFEVMRRFAKSGGRLGWDLYPLPGGKFDGNNSIGGQFSLGLVGGGNGWSEADEAGRAAIWEQHKQYTLEFYHFLTTDPAVPEKVRNAYARLGLCKDEFPEYGHFSPALYVREGRRMRGMYVLSQKDILEQPEKKDPIAVSSFPIDSHDCQRIALTDGGVINEGTIFPVRKSSPKQGYAYHVPYRSILPQPKECSNLLVPVALSCTHVGISSLRVEPTWMILGQSAGIAAALSARNESSVQDLPYKQLRDRLLAQGQVLELPLDTNANEVSHSIDPQSLPGIVLDNTSAELSGHWSHSTNFKPHIGNGYLHDEKRGDGKATAVFRFKVPQSGRYQLLMAYSAHESRANNVPLTVFSGAKKARLSVDQTRTLPQGKHFRPLGIVELQDDVETKITITNDKTSGFVILDAIQLLPAK
tara:strand:- start:33570 stop:35636 length:2067 start_codon:yes stop_codon:yes gene_type:complete